MRTVARSIDRGRQGWNSAWRMLLGVSVLGAAVAGFGPGVRAQEHGEHSAAGQGPMRGMMQGKGGPGGMMGQGQDMQTIHALFAAHQDIQRTVKQLANGVETLTESEDAKVQALIQVHVAAMYKRLDTNSPIRQWDPLYAEIFKQAGKIKMEVVNTKKGIRVVETSSDPWVVKLLQAHAEGVSEFVKEGMAAMHKEHPLPPAAP
jgi:uncharacterized protein